MSSASNNITRRDFVKASFAGAAAFAAGRLAESSAVAGSCKGAAATCSTYPIRLGGPIFEEYDDPAGWVKAVKNLGYSAAYCPVGIDADDDEVKAYEKAAAQADIVIAEVGVWNNPLDPDEKIRREAIEKCWRCLDLADRIGANCCVNVCGSRGDDGINLTEETFDMIVETVRTIIDGVKPRRSYYTLETLPDRYPDSVESCVRLMKAIDRDRCAAHLDPVNLVNSPRRYFNNAELIRQCFAALGPHIRSCHGKDIRKEPGFPVHLQECQPGLGKLDYAVYLQQLSRLPQQPPLMLEHLEEPEEYAAAAKYIRQVGKNQGLKFA